MISLSRQLARRVVGSRFEVLPPEVAERAKGTHAPLPRVRADRLSN